jgi:erythrocyte band 7 integral membrane protein
MVSADEPSPTWTGWERALAAITSFFLVITFPISAWYCLKTVEPHQNAVIFRSGKIKPGGVRGPGLFFWNPVVDSLWTVDMRQHSVPVEKPPPNYYGLRRPPPPTLQTRDNHLVTYKYRAYFRVEDPAKVVTKLNQPGPAVEMAVSDKLPNIVSQLDLAQLTNSESCLASMIKSTCNESLKEFGVQITSVVILQLRVLPEGNNNNPFF